MFVEENQRFLASRQLARPTQRWLRLRRPWLVVLIGFFLAAPAAPAAPTEADEVDQLLRLASRALQEEDRDAAERALSEATRRSPDSVQAWVLRGRTAALDERFEDCSAHLQKAQALGARDARTLLYLGSCSWEINRLDAAELALEGAVESAAERFPIALHYLGRLRLFRGDAPGAVEPLRRAAQQMPGAVDVRLDLARALDRARLDEEAVSEYRRVIERAPLLTNAYWGVAQVLRRLGRLEEAKAALGQFKALYQQDQERVQAQGLHRARLDEGHRLLAAEKAQAALELFSELGEEADALAGLAQAALVLGDETSAREALERAVTVDPTRRDLANWLRELRLADSAASAEIATADSMSPEKSPGQDSLPREPDQPPGTSR